MKKNNTESKIREAAQNQMANPPTFVWENIQEEIHPKKRKRRMAFWWIGSGISTVIILSVLLLRSNKEEIVINPKVTKSELNTTYQNKQKIKSESKITFGNIEQIANYKDGKDNAHFNLKNEPIEEKNNGIKIIANSANDVAHKNIIQTNDIVSIKNQNLLANNTEQLIDKSRPKTNVSKTESLSINPKERPKYTGQLISTLASQNLFYSRRILGSASRPILDTKIKIETFTEFGLIGGYHNIKLSQGLDENLFNMRNNSESTWYSTGVYGNVGIKIYDNWHISLGAEWIMSKNKFESESKGITKMIITFDSSSGSAIDTNFVSGTMFDKGDITLHLIDIPLSLGYTISKNKWQYGIEITGLLNIKTAAEGKVFSNEEGGRLLNGQENIYKSSIGLGLKGSLLFARKINDSYTIQIRPSYKTYINTINRDNYALPTRYNLFSTSLGIRKEF